MQHFQPRLLVHIVSYTLFFALVTGVNAQSFGGAFEGVGDNDKPIQIEADRLEIVDDENTALLTGNVSVVQGTTILKARKIKVFYLRGEESKQSKSGIKRIEASGKVAVRSEENQATADRATVNMVTEIVTMSGNVIMSQGNNIAKGCEVVVNLKTNVSEIKQCGGRVKLLLDPKSRNTN